MTRLARLSLALFSLLGACNGTPSVSRGQDVLATYIDGGKSERLTLRNFTKTADDRGELFGHDLYVMDFTATAEFLADSRWSLSNPFFEADHRARLYTFPLPPRPVCAPGASCFNIVRDPEAANKGDRLQLKGTLEFERINGTWQPDGAHFTVTRIAN